MNDDLPQQQNELNHDDDDQQSEHSDVLDQTKALVLTMAETLE